MIFERLHEALHPPDPKLKDEKAERLSAAEKEDVDQKLEDSFRRLKIIQAMVEPMTRKYHDT